MKIKALVQLLYHVEKRKNIQQQIVTNNLPTCHALTGCDTVRIFFHGTESHTPTCVGRVSTMLLHLMVSATELV